MPAIYSDIKQYGSANMPVDDVSTNGGDINLSDEITGVSIGEIFPTYSISDTSNNTWYYKTCILNSNTTYSVYGLKFWIWNGLIQPNTSGTVAITPESALDTSDKIVRIVGESSTGVEIEENVVLSGTTTVYSVNSYSKVYRVEVRSSISPYPLVSCNGNIHIVRGIELGIIPYDSANTIGCTGATGEISISLEPALNSDDSFSNRLTCPNDGLATPTDYTFSIPNSSVTALSCVGSSGTLPAQSFQGIWWKVYVEPEAKTSEDMPIWLRFSGRDVA